MQHHARTVILAVLVTLAIVAFIAGVIVFSTQRASKANNGNAAAPAEAIDCADDSDCVPAGCSNQLCVARGIASHIVTTCEYRSEYGCRAQDTCLCRAGKCQWASGPSYLSCLDTQQR